MRYYHMYMDRQGISREAHEKLLALTAPRRRVLPRWAAGAAALAACCALCLGLWRLAGPAQTDGQLAADALYPGIKDTYDPGRRPRESRGTASWWRARMGRP